MADRGCWVTHTGREETQRLGVLWGWSTLRQSRARSPDGGGGGWHWHSLSVGIATVELVDP